ncbi:MAG: hypothetical protein PUH29_11630 [Lachnospiraceae bacterium]|nr:hypothetical protein [Lachnospiraceae bacterium]MDY5497639.1 hypothetical protein [Anaerobutyricum sp.]
MFEMLITVVATCAATLYGLSKSVFMNGPHQRFYRIAAIILLISAFIVYRIYHKIKYSKIRKMNVDLGDYLYYDKYTSPLYRIGYYISYLIQNILFDYTYMRRNFNFCKGLDVYDGGVSEYYIKFRNTWYRYLKLTNIRHYISLKKLQAYACSMKNDMIYDALSTDEEKELYHSFEKEIEKYFEENHTIDKYVIERFPHYMEVNYLFSKNVMNRCIAIYKAKKREPELKRMVERQNFRKERDVTDYKKTSFR